MTCLLTVIWSGCILGSLRSVLGPVLFLAYINDITTGVRSSNVPVCDDRKVYRIIYNEKDEKQLECDLNMLQKWNENWQLRFHPDKCEVLWVTHARDHTSYPYKLSGCMLQSVTKTVDLGDSLISNLSWKTQMQKVVNKANKIVGFIKRNVGPGNKEDSFLVCTRPWLYPFWNMLTLPGHPIYRTLTLLNESNIGPQNTLSQCHLGTLCTMKDWQCLSGPVFNQGGLIYLC